MPNKIIKDHFITGNTIYESSTGEWFGCPVGLPIPMQIEETKWLKNPKIPLIMLRIGIKVKDGIKVIFNIHL